MSGDRTRVCLLPDPNAIGVARAVVREAARGLRHEVLEDAVLLTSELVTNAIRHGGSHIELTADAEPGILVVAVYDDGTAFRVGDLGRPRPEAVSGRGLGMVHRVAHAWGVRDGDGAHGKTVWFRLGGADGYRGPGPAKQDDSATGG